MANRSPITEDAHWFINEDRTLEFLVTADDAPLDMTNYELEWVLRRNVDDYTAAIIKSTGGFGITVSDGVGTGDLAQVDIYDIDTVGLPEGVYQHALRRKDEGSEVVLSFGSAILQKASA